VWIHSNEILFISLTQIEFCVFSSSALFCERHGVDFANVYAQLLRMQIPKVQKDLTVSFGLLVSAGVKAAHKHVGEIDPWGHI